MGSLPANPVASGKSPRPSGSPRPQNEEAGLFSEFYGPRSIINPIDGLGHTIIQPFCKGFLKLSFPISRADLALGVTFKHGSAARTLEGAGW